MQPPTVKRAHSPFQQFIATAPPLCVSIAKGTEETADTSTADTCTVGLLGVRPEEGTGGTNRHWLKELREGEDKGHDHKDILSF